MSTLDNPASTAAVQTANATPFSNQPGQTAHAASSAAAPLMCADLAPKHIQIGAADMRVPASVAYAVFAKTALLWDTSTSTTITYSFLPGPTSGTAIQQQKVAKYIGEWSWYANVNFSLVDAATVPASMIRITFDAQAGNWSYVGNLALAVPATLATMNLGSVADGPDDPIERSIILHEFGHALGLTHEHHRDVALDPDATKTFYASAVGWSPDQVQENILGVYDKRTLTNFLKYDSSSIMKSFMEKQMDVNRVDVLPNSELSEQDKAFTVVNYPLPQINPNAPQWTLSHALSVLGVSDYYKHAMLLARPADVRKQYALWLAEQLLMIPGRLPTKPHGPDCPPDGGDMPGENPAWFKKTCSDLALHLKADSEDQSSSSIAFAVMSKSTLLWDNGETITYSFLGGNPTQQQKVDTVAQEWTKYANVAIKKVASGGQIRITFNSNDGSWSYVGREILNVDATKATMNFGWVKGTSSTVTNEEKGTILHEFGHALGLLHEHQSPARGGTLTLNEKNVYAYYEETQGWSRALVKEQIIDVYARDDVSNYSQLDLTSIMMYFMPAEMNTQHVEVKPNYAFSELDKAYIVINYPFQTKDPKWTLAYALEVAGVTGFARESIAKEKDATVIRQKFTIWNAASRAETIGGRSRGGDPTTGRGVQGDEGGGEWDDLAGFDTTFDKKVIEDVSQTRTNWCASEDPDVSQDDNEDIQSDDEEDTVDDTGPARGVAEGENVLWPVNKPILFWFQQSTYRLPIVLPSRLIHRDLMRQALREWSEASRLTISEAESEDKAHVRIWLSDTVIGARRSHCMIGRRALFDTNPPHKGGNARTTLYIHLPSGSLAPGKPDRLDALRSCRHEVGHMLGLRHEHVSPVSQTVPVNEVNKDRITFYSDWDPLSIMLYPNEQLAADPTQVTGRNTVLSDKDKLFVKMLYARRMDVLAQCMLQMGLSEDAVTAVRTRATNTEGIWRKQMQEARKELATQLRLRFGPPQLAPAHGAEDPSTEDGHELTKGEFLPILIKSLKKFFNPGGNQMFTLQFPGRFLQMSQYAWDTGSAGIYGQFIKPVVVNESEFRLTDQLYDVAEVVSGPNGNSLSQAYTTVLNNLLPIFRNNGLAAQQDQIRQWLLREVKTSTWVREIIDRQHTRDTDDSVDDSEVDAGGTQTNGDGPAFAISNKLSEDGTVNRMELSNALMQEYLMAKQAWEVERDAMIEEALQLKLGTTESSAALNTLTRRLAHTTAAREAQLAARYSDAVVRGYTHNVREYVGYLDVRTSAEALQDAKDSLREAAMSSLDGSLNVYPVQMTPIDWFESLSTSFTLEDLTQDPDLIYQQIRAKSQQLDVLNSQLTALRFGSKGDPEQLRDAVTQAQENLDNAQANLALKYSSNIISVAKTCYTKDGSLDEGQLGGLVESGDIVGAVLNDLINDMQSTSAAQKALTSATRAYSQALAGYALAQATDTRQQQEQIRLQVEGITSDLNELNARFTSLNSGGRRPHSVDLTSESQVSIKDVPSFPTPDDTAGGSRWQEFVMNHQVQSDYSKSSSSSSASASAMHVNLWLFSADTSSSSSQAMSMSEAHTSTDNVTLAFRATLVTADRSGWFQPQFFKQSNTFYHVDPTVTWSKWPSGVQDATTLKGLPQKGLDSLNSQSLLPAFPVAYIICKDITIKISSAESNTASSRETMRKNAAASGGILCFSYSHSSSSSSDNSSYSFQSCSDGCVIRIPGPQILGYIMQLTDNDTTKDMPTKLPDNFFIPDADYDAATSGTGGQASGLNPGSGKDPTVTPFFQEIDGILNRANVPAATLKGIHEAIRRELNTLSEDVASRVKQG